MFVPQPPAFLFERARPPNRQPRRDLATPDGDGKCGRRRAEAAAEHAPHGIDAVIDDVHSAVRSRYSRRLPHVPGRLPIAEVRSNPRAQVASCSMYRTLSAGIACNSTRDGPYRTGVTRPGRSRERAAVNEAASRQFDSTVPRPRGQGRPHLRSQGGRCWCWPGRQLF